MGLSSRSWQSVCTKKSRLLSQSCQCVQYILEAVVRRSAALIEVKDRSPLQRWCPTSEGRLQVTKLVWRKVDAAFGLCVCCIPKQYTESYLARQSSRQRASSNLVSPRHLFWWASFIVFSHDHTLFFPECVAKIPVCTWGSGGAGRVCEEVRNRSQPFAVRREARAIGIDAKKSFR